MFETFRMLPNLQKQKKQCCQFLKSCRYYKIRETQTNEAISLNHVKSYEIIKVESDLT